MFATRAKKQRLPQGITYSVLSASWDPDREGSVLGAAEFRRNLGSIQEGLRRSRDNALLREKLAGLSPVEIQAALSDLDRRDAAAAANTRQTPPSLRNKLSIDLEE